MKIPSHLHKYAHRYALVLVVMLASLAFLPGYNYAFPTYHVDEGLILREVLARNDVADHEVSLQGYPPPVLMAYQYAYYVADILLPYDVLQDNPYIIIQFVRLASGLVNVVTAAIIFLCGRRMSNLGVGFVAAVAWSMMPYITFRTLVALAEPWIVLGFVLSLYGGIRVFQDDQWQWAVWSVLAGLMAVTFKYSAFPILGVGVGAVLWQLYRYRGQRKVLMRWLGTLGLQIALIIGCAWLLLYGYGFAYLPVRGEVERFTGGWVASLMNFEQVIEIFAVSTTRIGVELSIFSVVVLVGGGLYLLKQPTWRRLSIIFLFGAWFINTYFVVTYILFELSIIKYTIPATGLGALLFAASLFALCTWVGTRLNSNVIGTLLFVIASVVWIIPHAYDQLSMTYYRSRPSTYAALTEWASDTISYSGTIFLADIQRDNSFGETETNQFPWLSHGAGSRARNIGEWMIFDPLWGGYRGQQMPWLVQDEEGSFTDKTLEEWRDLHVNYVMLDSDRQARMMDSANDGAIFDEVLLLRSFPANDETGHWRGAELSVYRLWGMEYETDVVLGDLVRLRGYDLSAMSIAAGEVLQLTPYWQALQTPSTNYNVYLHLVPLDTRDVIAQADGRPTRTERPMVTWTVPEEVLIGNTLSLSIPADTPAGAYRLIMGLYDLTTGQRLLTETGDDFVTIDTIDVMIE